MTLEGTNTYVVARDGVYVIDPGPADRRHVDAVLAATEGRGEIERAARQWLTASPQ